MAAYFVLFINTTPLIISSLTAYLRDSVASRAPAFD